MGGKHTKMVQGGREVDRRSTNPFVLVLGLPRTAKSSSGQISFGCCVLYGLLIKISAGSFESLNLICERCSSVSFPLSSEKHRDGTFSDPIPALNHVA